MRDFTNIAEVDSIDGQDAANEKLREGWVLLDVQAHREHAPTFILGKHRPAPKTCDVHGYVEPCPLHQ